VPGFKIRGAGGIVSRVGGRGRVDVAHTGRAKAKAEQAAGLEDGAHKDLSTCFVSDPTEVRVKRRNVATGAVKAQDGDKANSGCGDEENIVQHHFVAGSDT